MASWLWPRWNMQSMMVAAVGDAGNGEKKETEFYYGIRMVIGAWVHHQILTIYLSRCVKHHL